MKLGYGNEIKFDLVNGTVTRYLVILDGEPTLAIQCDQADPERAIKILTIGGDHSMVTKGRFELAQKLTENADGEPIGVETRVNSRSVYRYAVPRLHSLMGRLLRAAA